MQEEKTISTHYSMKLLKKEGEFQVNKKRIEMKRIQKEWKLIIKVNNMMI